MFSPMDIESSRIAAALVSAPIVARLALTSANPGVVERAAGRLADFIAEKLSSPDQVIDARQMSLFEESNHE